MPVTLVEPKEEKEAFRKQIDRLTSSHLLHGSENLCKMLHYLSRNALEHPGASVKEYQLATEVFGRPADFDPHLDATIRVQAGRLRAKLSEYYATVGQEDPVVVELPKGTYALAFHSRETRSAVQAAAGTQLGVERRKPAQRTVRNLLIAVLGLSILLAAAIATIAALAIARKPAASLPAQPEAKTSTALQTLWQPFLTDPDAPWVIFSNAAFVGRPETGMRYYNPSQDSGDSFMDFYTGVGEVLAVRDLDHLFGELKRKLRIKRGSLFTLDDAKNNDLIFVGSPAENLTLREIPGTHEFVFQRIASGPRKGDLAIENVHPQPGEPGIFIPSPPHPPLAEDYSIIALTRGLNPRRSTLVLAGTSTLGTQAAVEFVCQPDSVQELLRRLGVSSAADLQPFEALLQVEVKHEVPVGIKLLAVRKQDTSEAQNRH